MKTITWDLNGTLIKPNPEFKQIKYDFTRLYFQLDKSTEEIHNAFKKANKEVELTSETYGVHIPQVLCFTKLLENLEVKSSLYKIEDFITEYEQLYLETPPTFYDENTFPVLDKIAEDYENVILSNISFIGAATMHKLMRKVLKVPYQTVTQMVFSGQDSIAKPDSRFYFKHALYHVGDNPITDGLGPQQVGVDSYLINSSNGRSISDFYNHLIKNKQIHEKQIPVRAI